MRWLIVVVVVAASCRTADVQYRGDATTCKTSSADAPKLTLLVSLHDSAAQEALLGVTAPPAKNTWTLADAASVHFDEKVVAIKGAFDQAGDGGSAFDLEGVRDADTIKGTFDLDESGTAVTCSDVELFVFDP